MVSLDMHKQALDIMRELLTDHVKPGQTVLDVGSYDVNGTLRPLCEELGLIYSGLDLEPGPNVDIVSENPYEFPLATDSFDVVVSCSTMEHVQAIWRWVPELVRVLKPGGLLAITTHTCWPFHGYPVDCWRIMPDGMVFLLNETGLLVPESYTLNLPNENDIGISARKKKRGK